MKIIKKQFRVFRKKYKFIFVIVTQDIKLFFGISTLIIIASIYGGIILVLMLISYKNAIVD